jgi:Flp pilus assembly protein TadG
MLQPLLVPALDRQLASVRPRRARAQSLVEFAFAIGLFLVMVLAIVDFGRAIFLYNGVSEAAADIARVTSVYAGAPLGSSSQTGAAITSEQSIIWGLGNPTFTCVDLTGTPVTGACLPGFRVQVTISATYSAIAPLLDLLAPITVSASATVTVQ